MIRWSMLVGWWELIRHSHRARPQRGGDDFVIVCRTAPKRIDLGTELASSNNTPRGTEKLPEQSADERRLAVPEPGDVTKRHKTTTLFDESDDDADEKKEKRIREEDVV